MTSRGTAHERESGTGNSDAATAPMPAFDVTRSWHPCGRFVKLESLGGRVHVVSVPGPAPDAPHVLFLHGILQSSWTWRANLEALASQMHVHAVCLPGFGWSDKPETSYRLVHQAERMLELLDVLQVPRAHVVGNSLGGALSLQLAVVAPQRVGRILLVNPAGAGLYPMALLAAMQHQAAAPLLHLPGVGMALALGLRHGAYARMAVDRPFVHSFLQPLKSAGAGRAALKVARYFNRDMAALDRRLPDVASKVLLMWGKGDRVVPLAAVRRLARRLPDARVELYDCSGHCPMEEEPGRFNREALAFLTAQGPAKGPSQDDGRPEPEPEACLT